MGVKKMKLSKERRSGRATKGSRFHLQNLINKNQNLLNKLILDASPTLGDTISGTIKWVSPLEKEDYLEYQDKEFLEVIGNPQLEKDLLSFWPEGGPVWDALAIFPTNEEDKNGVILLEAKSYIGELAACCKAKNQSRDKITKTFERIKDTLGVPANAPWMEEYYQYANRLAHLYFLRIVQKIPSWLVFLYFIGDLEQGGPTRKEEWYTAIDDIKETLSLQHHHGLSDYIINVFPNL